MKNNTYTKHDVTNEIFPEHILASNQPAVNLVIPNSSILLHVIKNLYKRQSRSYSVLALSHFKHLGLRAIRQGTHSELRKLWLDPNLLIIIISEPEISSETIQFEISLLLEKRIYLNRGATNNQYKTILLSIVPIQYYPQLAGIPFHIHTICL